MGLKTEKELAFLHELFIATDWGERFAELIDEHVVLPKEGRVLYLAAGTGGHALALQERSSARLEFVCMDENEECLEVARAKAAALKDPVEFIQTSVDSLSIPSDQFDVVIGEGSLVPTERIRGMLGEMVRVAKPGGAVALSLPTFSSFGEFFSIYWEALHNAGFTDHESEVETLITVLPRVTAVEQMAEHAGLDQIQSWTRIEEFDYGSGESFLNAPLISDFLMNGWLKQLPEESRARVAEEIARLINEDRHEGDFALSVKATLVLGKKALNQ